MYITGVCRAKMAVSRKKSSLSETLECPVCENILEKPIRQCNKGHSFCTKCIRPNAIRKCPESKCHGAVLDTRNFKLEELLETVDLPCPYSNSGCKYTVKKEQLKSHSLECKHALFKCEGAKFHVWKCKWEGTDILQHFQTQHPAHTTMEYNTQVSIKYDATHSTTDLQLIPAHHQLFWYKHQIDIKNANAYWAFQFIGPRNEAISYYYEFEFFNPSQPIRKFKITEYCRSHAESISEIFNAEACVVISLKALKSYVDDQDEYSFRFRIMKLKKDDVTVKQLRAVLRSTSLK